VTERATGRHRASHRSTSSSLATLTGPLSVVGEYVGSVRRSGVIIAMSSGLVATMALPAHAVGGGPAEVSGPQTASIPAVPAAEGSSAFFASPQGGLLSVPDGMALEDGTVSAPVTAALDFDHPGFVAVPTPDGISVQVTPRTGVRTPRTGSASTGDLNLTQRPVTTRTSQTEQTEQTQQTEQKAKAPATRREARRTATTGATARTSTTSTKSSSSTQQSAAVPASATGSAAVALASRYIGTPYRFGGARPGGFDCSGLVQYVYKQLGKKLPRTAAEQAAAVRHVPRSQARPGDLVLFPGGGHIGIYVGNGMMLDAPHTGTRVQIRKIYSAGARFGRVV
jgi:peptidoglycan DL-endopeptidase CwlO